VGRDASQLLQRHVQDCETLHADVSALIEDLKVVADVGVVRYAVDFAEIFSYTFPHSQTEYMRVFHDDDMETLRMAQHVASNVLFDNPFTRLILLAPYAVEMRAFVSTWSRHHFEELAEKIAGARAEANELKNDAEFQLLHDLVTQHDRDLPEDLVTHVVSFFEAKGARLVKLMEDLNRAPGNRLTALLKRKPFDTLDSILPGHLELEELDQDIIERWEAGLLEVRKGRPPGSSYLDGVAVAMIKAANDRLTGSKTRLRLITKSKTMRELFQKELDDGLWDGVNTNMLRHPRSLVALGALRRESGTAALGRLVALEKSLAVFLASYEERGGGERSPRRTTEQLESRISSIKREWRALTGLSSAVAAGRPDDLASDTSVDVRGQISRILDFVRSYETVTKLIERRIDELADALGRGYQSLGLLLQGQRTGQQAILEKKIDYNISESTALLTYGLHWMPYRIQFYSPEVSEWVKRIHGRAELRLTEALDWFRRSVSPGPQYERLLWLAYLFGGWGRWRLAEMYCDLALSTETFQDEPPRHEGLFFLALCRRRLASRASEYREAQRALDEAQQALSQVTGRRDVEDPRFLRERGMLFLRWREAYQRPGSSTPGEPSPPPIDEALHLLERSLELVGDDDRLAAQIHNDLCYHYLDDPQDYGHTRAREHYERLVEVQKRLERNEKKWPPNILDTFALASWRLRDDSFTANDKRELVDLLEIARRNAETSGIEESLAEEHLKEIRGSEL